MLLLGFVSSCRRDLVLLGLEAFSLDMCPFVQVS